MTRSIFLSLVFHSAMIVITAITLPFMKRMPVDLPPIFSVDLIQITDETISRQSLSTGEILVLSGKLVSLVERENRGWISLFSESTNSGNRWEIMARDPPGVVFEIPGNAVTPYSVTAKALEPGVYHVHTQLNVATVGPGLGPGTTVVVYGEPILKPIAWGMLAYQSVMIGAAYVVTFATRPWKVI